MQERWFFKIKHKLSLSNGVYEIISTFNREQLFKLIALTKFPLIFLHLNKSSLSNTEKYTSKLLTLESSILLLLKSLTCFHNFLSRAISDSCLNISLSFTNCSVVKYSKWTISILLAERATFQSKSHFYIMIQLQHEKCHLTAAFPSILQFVRKYQVASLSRFTIIQYDAYL